MPRQFKLAKVQWTNDALAPQLYLDATGDADGVMDVNGTSLGLTGTIGDLCSSHVVGRGDLFTIFYACQDAGV